jgi:hypothetical protein
MAGQFSPEIRQTLQDVFDALATEGLDPPEQILRRPSRAPHKRQCSRAFSSGFVWWSMAKDDEFWDMLVSAVD